MRAKLSKIFDSNSSTKQKKKEYLDAKKAGKQAEKRALKSGGSSGGGEDDDEGNGSSYGNESIPNSVATTAKGRAAELRLERRAQGLGEEEEAHNSSSKKNRYGSDERMPAKPTVNFSFILLDIEHEEQRRLGRVHTFSHFFCSLFCSLPCRSSYLCHFLFALTFLLSFKFCPKGGGLASSRGASHGATVFQRQAAATPRDPQNQRPKARCGFQHYACGGNRSRGRSPQQHGHFVVRLQRSKVRSRQSRNGSHALARRGAVQGAETEATCRKRPREGPTAIEMFDI